MLRTEKARTLKLCFVAAFFIALGGITWSGFAQDLPAEKVFKNIQALKGVPANQIPTLMESYNRALGVNCEYCHVAGALEKADKAPHKLAVRDIQMVRDINQRYKMQVECMNCHQGKATPSGALASTSGTSKPPDPGTTKPPDPGTKPPPGGTTGKPEAMPPGDNAIIKAPTPYGNVPFPHEKHTMAVSDCKTCHHTGVNNKCSTCHLDNRKPSQFTKITGYEAMHNRTSPRACWGCHLQQKAGPTSCATCHKK